MSKLSFLFAFETPLAGQAPPYDSEALVTPYTQSIDHIWPGAKTPDRKTALVDSSCDALTQVQAGHIFAA